MRPNELFSTAIAIVRRELSPDSVKIIRFSTGQNQSYETFLQHVGFGVAIRNLLAKNGIFWEDAALCSVWLEILKESIKTFPDKQLSETDTNGSNI